MSRQVPSHRLLGQLSRLCESDTTRRSTRAVWSYHTTTRSTLSRWPVQQTYREVAGQRRFFTDTQPTPTSQSNGKSSSADTEANEPASLPDVTNYYTLFPETLPSGPPPSGTFSISQAGLRREFLRLQSQHHPDKYTGSATAHQKSVALSALINQAYRTLSDPLLRAQYLLLQTYGVDVTSEDNSAHPTDQHTLLEVMDAQERIEEAQTEADIQEIKAENQERLKQTGEKMGKAFEDDDLDTAKRECVRMKYWSSLQQGLHEWEPGKEVRLIH